MSIIMVSPNKKHARLIFIERGVERIVSVLIEGNETDSNSIDVEKVGLCRRANICENTRRENSHCRLMGLGWGGGWPVSEPQRGGGV